MDKSFKLSCEQSDLEKALGIVRGAVATKTTMNTLTHILIDATSKGIEVCATDLEIAIKAKLKGDVLQPGAMSVPADKLCNFVSELPSGKVELTSNADNKFTVRARKARMSITGLDKEHFPVLPTVSSDRVIPIQQTLLHDMIKKTHFAASTDETRYNLNGIFLKVEKGRVFMVTTDGQRLVYMGLPEQKDIDKKFTCSAIIPAKAAAECGRVFSSGEVRMIIGDNQIAFDSDGPFLVARLIEGTFPNYDQVIPKDCKIKFKAKTQDLKDCVDRVALLNQGRSASIKLTLTSGRLIASSTAQGIGDAEDEIGVEYNGERIEVAYNPTFISDALKNVDSDETTIEMPSPVKPGIIRPATSKNGAEYLCVIMPMRL